MRILLSAGEPSGDAIGTELAKAFSCRNLSVEMAGCAGDGMRSQGVRTLADASDFSFAGWSSVLARLPWLVWRAMDYYRKARRFAPDLVVAIDAPGLNGPLLRRFRSRGTRVAWVAPPQLWAWKYRKPRLLQGMAVYPAHAFEVESLQAAGAVPRWWGYPGARPCIRRSNFPDRLALLPGSRTVWRARHLELFARAAGLAGLPLRTVLVHPSPSSPTEWGLPCLPPSQVFPNAALALSLPGTATLEAALWGVPTVVAARPGRLDERLARRRLSEGFRALPNRILGEAVFPEFYAREATPYRLARALQLLFEGRSQVCERLETFEIRLGGRDAPSRIVSNLLET